MYLIIALACFMLFALINNSEKYNRNKRQKMCASNTIVGNIEYHLAWHYFHNDIIPEIYRILIERGQVDVGIYDVEFDEVGYELYDKTPHEEAIVRAKKEVVKRGYTPYVDAWEWDEHRNRLSDFTLKQMREPLEERGKDFERRVDLIYYANCVIDIYGGYEKNFPPDVIAMIPSPTDLRRRYYKRAGSYLWRPKEDCLPSDITHRWPPRQRLGHPVRDPDYFIKDTAKWPE